MRLLLIALILILSACQACILEDEMPIPYQFSQFTEFTNMMHWYGIYYGTNPSMVNFAGTNHRRTFVAYQSPVIEYEAEGCDPYLVYYDWDSKEWYGPFQIGTCHIPGNPHSGVCLFIDGNDKLHAFWGSHGDKGNQQWTRSKNSIDNDTPFSDVVADDFETAKTFGSYVSYPQIVGIINSKLVILLRGETTGKAHSEKESWWESPNYADEWASASFSKIWEFIDSGDWDTATVYLQYTPVVDNEGDIHVAWGWWSETGKYHYNTLYARYDTSEGYWVKADGTPYIDGEGDPIPITLETAEVVTTKTRRWSENMDVDETNRPYIAVGSPSIGTKLYVWETDHWEERTPPANIALLEVISSNLLYIYVVEENTKLYRYQSTDRGINFTDPVLMGEWCATGSPTYGWFRPWALAKSRGTIPTMLGAALYMYTNQVPEGDEDYIDYYEVGRLIVASMGFDYVPSVILADQGGNALLQENGNYIHLGI